MKPGKDELTNYTTLYMILGGYRLKSSGLDLLPNSRKPSRQKPDYELLLLQII